MGPERKFVVHQKVKNRNGTSQETRQEWLEDLNYREVLIEPNLNESTVWMRECKVLEKSV